ncbi:MAG: hypothetical protein LBN26_09150 [Christensenellaceae bacterium]|jgi:hypothetical protein|nr:hypothetical protein [Christensenellaceae bacterium]
MGNKGDAKRNKLFGMLFTAVMIALCAALYLLREGLPAKQAAAEETPALPARIYPAEDIFVQNAQGYGLRAQWEAVESELPGSEYALKREGEEPARLQLSLRQGGVSGFVLVTPFLEAPKEPSPNATLIEMDLYEQRLARYMAEEAWRQTALAALLSALDVEETLAAADKDGMAYLVQRTLQTGDKGERKASGIDFSCYKMQEGGEGTLHVVAQLRD